MAVLKRHVGEAATLSLVFLFVLLIRDYNFQASAPNWLFWHWHRRFYTSSSSTAVPSFELHRPTESSDAAGQRPRVALCLVGGARAFELTAESILRHLIEPGERSDWIPDVFLHAPLDADAHKFTLLHNISAGSRSRLASARIFRPTPLPESDLHDEVLNAKSAPKGLQGLLQYFNLVEGCLEMIALHEDRHGFRYDWVARTRVDGFWTGSVPALGSLNASAYYVPIGSQFGGLNDRFGLGSRTATVAALSRLSLLPFLHERGKRKLNSESAFKAQMEELHVPCETIAVPFCILSRRTYRWPITDLRDVPVASIGTEGALNGAKCRPCTAAATGADAELALNKLSKRLGWPGHVRGLSLCNASGPWEKNWLDKYADVAGRQFEHQRERVLWRTREECEADVARFREQWEAWDAPSAEQICSRRRPQ